MERLTLGELVLQAKHFSNRNEIPFAEEPWRESSEVVWRTGDSTIGFEKEGKKFTYFIEPIIIVEQFEKFSDAVNLVDLAINYARNDA